MFTDRRIERHQLPYFLRVFNGITDKPIGFLGNVSEDGLMLISQLPMMIGADFDLRLKIPASEGGQRSSTCRPVACGATKTRPPNITTPGSACNGHRRSMGNWWRR